MNKLKIENINVLIFINFMISNILSIPILLFSIYKKKESPFLLGIFFAVLGYYFRPFSNDYDIARYYLMFSDLKLRRAIFLYQNDLYAEYMINFLIKWNMPKYFLGFTSAFLVYYFLFKTLKIILNKKESKIIYLLFYILLFIVIPIIGYTGIRFYPALSIFIYSLILSEKSPRVYSIYMLASCLIHSSMCLMVVLFVTNKFIIKKLSHKSLILIFFSCIIIRILLTANVFEKIVEIINTTKIIYIDSQYITGEWGIRYLNQFPITYKIKFLLFLYYKLFIIFLYVFIIKKENREMRSFLILLGSICFIVSQFHTLFDRYFYMFLTIAFFSSIKEYYNKKNNYIKLYLIFIFIHSLTKFIVDIKSNYLSFVLSYNNFFKVSILNIIIEFFK